MNNKTISITSPLDRTELLSAAETLTNLANTLEPTQSNVTSIANTVVNNDAVINTDLDQRGFPWDGRIHGAKKAKDAKGNWKYIRGVDKTVLVPQVEAELLAALVTTAPTATAGSCNTVAPPPDTTTVPAAPAVAMATMHVVNGEKFTADQLSDAGWNEEQIAGLPTIEMPLETLAETVTTFPELMSKINTGLQNGDITDQDIENIVIEHGIANLPAVATRPDQIPSIANKLFG